MTTTLSTNTVDSYHMSGQPNALVQLQAHLTMRAQRAVQTCLSAATFVRQRAASQRPVRSRSI